VHWGCPFYNMETAWESLSIQAQSKLIVYLDIPLEL